MSAPRLNQHTAMDELAPRTPIDRVAARVLSRGEREIVKTASGKPWADDRSAEWVAAHCLVCPRCKVAPILIVTIRLATVGCAGCRNHYHADRSHKNGTLEAIERVAWSWNHWARAAA